MITNLEAKLSGLEPIDREELFELVSSWGRKDEFETFDDITIYSCEPRECYPLENLDVSQIDNLSDLFLGSFYNGDLSNWDVFNCLNMDYMFSFSKFNNNSLKYWDTSKVEKMSFMFLESKFNGNISNWNISNVESMSNIFESSSFCNDISNWKFNKNISCYNIFYDNDDFINKYNNGKKIPLETEDFLIWFENNREKMKELNQDSKEEVLNFFSFPCFSEQVM